MLCSTHRHCHSAHGALTSASQRARRWAPPHVRAAGVGRLSCPAPLACHRTWSSELLLRASAAHHGESAHSGTWTSRGSCGEREQRVPALLVVWRGVFRARARVHVEGSCTPPSMELGVRLPHVLVPSLLGDSIRGHRHSQRVHSGRLDVEGAPEPTRSILGPPLGWLPRFVRCLRLGGRRANLCSLRGGGRWQWHSRCAHYASSRQHAHRRGGLGRTRVRAGASGRGLSCAGSLGCGGWEGPLLARQRRSGAGRGRRRIDGSGEAGWSLASATRWRCAASLGAELLRRQVELGGVVAWRDSPIRRW
mmetsp:Transcript_4015/g.11368  ORF Transcript_4015/g.11368 Transcript_4015/m.11368 type:complete len:307 (-) Transcript_4015:507-1427(-)